MIFLAQLYSTHIMNVMSFNSIKSNDVISQILLFIFKSRVWKRKAPPLLPAAASELDLYYNTMTLFFLLYSVKITNLSEYFYPPHHTTNDFLTSPIEFKTILQAKKNFLFPSYNLFFSYNVSFIMHIFTLLYLYRQSSLLFNIFVAFYSTLIRIQSLKYKRMYTKHSIYILDSTTAIICYSKIAFEIINLAFYASYTEQHILVQLSLLLYHIFNFYYYKPIAHYITSHITSQVMLRIAGICWVGMVSVSIWLCLWQITSGLLNLMRYLR